MKNMLLLGLAVLTLQGAFARDFDRPGPGGPGPGFPGPGDRMDLMQCLKTLGNAETTISDLKLQLNQCQVSRPGPGPGFPGPGRDPGRTERENEMLRRDLDNAKRELDMTRRDLDSTRRDSGRLAEDNSKLSQENLRLSSDTRRLADENFSLSRQVEDLRRQLDDMRNPPRPARGFYSYAACKSSNGLSDMRYISSAMGMFPIESESNAQIQTNKDFSCNYGTSVIKTEEIRSTVENNYCVAGCVASNGTIDTKYIVGARGRNQAEAEFKALKETQTKYSCNYGTKIQVCQ